MKTIFVTGKGGVGKSTLSAALAWQLAHKGQKVLAVSLDPAHNLGDVFGVSLGPRKTKHAETLYLQEVDLTAAAERYTRENASLLKQTYSYLTTVNFDRYFDVLKYSPGVEEYAALLALEEIVRRETGFDTIVFDTPPTGLTLRVLALPRLALTWTERLVEVRKQILQRRYTIHKIAGDADGGGTRLAFDEADDRVMTKLLELRQRYELLQRFLRGAQNTIAIVLNPDALSQRESERLMEGLADLELPLRVAFHNKVTDGDAEVVAAAEARLFGDHSAVVTCRVPLMDRTKTDCTTMAHDLTTPFL